MIIRFEIKSKVFDARAKSRRRKLQDYPFANKIKDTFLVDVYTLEKKLSPNQLNKIASMFPNPVTQEVTILNPKYIRKSKDNKFSWAIEIGYLPGVTDNIASTAKESIEDLLKVKFLPKEGVYTSQITFIDGDLTNGDAKQISESLYNPIIQRVSIKSYSEYIRDNGMDFVIPKVKLSKKPQVDKINLDVSDEELKRMGKEGIKNSDGTRRGPLALRLPFMKAIQAHFKKLDRKPTDIELESIAQTWSEHCKHTIFADPIDEVSEGLFKKYIKGATDYIRKKKGRNDFCVSVFKDNSGAIEFDDDYLITHKVETHNSPSALDPFGGAITGIVGVNRDTIGFGLGAKPVANFYGFCFADPRVDTPLYKGANYSQKMLSSRRIMDGVIEGVNAGGNQSGIPTPSGFLYFDERYRGKPLVFVGTVGLIPKKIKGKLSYTKKARNGDYIVMIGGRVGKDGIHGATFSSEAMDSGSPSTAVQIGDPITQKKLSDAIVKEAREMDLYHSITDNGAGGLSCSVAEMAKESGGCIVDLDKVPLKYPGLEPWEIWVSESQERMTLAVPKKNWKKFEDLMKRRGVEATVIGKFTNVKKCQVYFRGQKIMDLGMDFLHYGLPQRNLTSSYTQPIEKDPSTPPMTIGVGRDDTTRQFIEMISRLNLTSFAFISQQYDHMVQSSLILPPLQGRGRVNAEAVVLKPVLNSNRGIVLSYGLYPSYSDIDTYHMAASSIDTAIRSAVSAGANPERIALLDNFCWCSSDDPERLGQLKRAVKACYDMATVFKTPFISGKDSMFNDFKGYDRNGKPIKISIPPTLLISSIGVVDDITKVVSLDVKFPGDLVYILGDTYMELGGSEYFSLISEKQGNNSIGNNVPKVNAIKNKKLYSDFYQCVKKQLIPSSISINHGGLGVALAKMAIGGGLGLDIRLNNLPGLVTRSDFALFSESQGRIIVTISPKNKNIFEKLMGGNSFALIGKVINEPKMIIRGLKGDVIINTSLKKIQEAYTSTFKGY